MREHFCICLIAPPPPVHLMVLHMSQKGLNRISFDNSLSKTGRGKSIRYFCLQDPGGWQGRESVYRNSQALQQSAFAQQHSAFPRTDNPFSLQQTNIKPILLHLSPRNHRLYHWEHMQHSSSSLLASPTQIGDINHSLIYCIRSIMGLKKSIFCFTKSCCFFRSLGEKVIYGTTTCPKGLLTLITCTFTIVHDISTMYVYIHSAF